MKENEIKALVDGAFLARERAYVPYSHFRVGAALLTKQGRVYHGCNIENASYTPTNCAERTAVFKAVYEGEREFAAIAIVSDSKNPTAPCGVCRQVLAEFCEADMPVICANRDGEYEIMTLSALIPMVFTKKDMEE